MNDAIRQLDQRFSTLRALAGSQRPPKGWLRAIRGALGMTTAQFGRRLGMAQPSVVELEQSEATNSITLRTLERAAEALGCRVVYALIPNEPLSEMVRKRAAVLADRKLATVGQTMRLEDQAVKKSKATEEAKRQLTEELLRKPARLWDDP
jgi:predicted DNA-binding mobile mystery protein A